MTEAVLVALLLSDRVVVEEKTRKKSIIGTFSRMNARRFPAVFPPWYIYAAVTNVYGDNPFTLKLIRSSDDKVILPIAGTIKAQDRRTVVEMVFAVGNAVFPGPGTYTLVFSVGDMPIGSRLLDIVDRSASGPPGPRRYGSVGLSGSTEGSSGDKPPTDEEPPNHSGTEPDVDS